MQKSIKKYIKKAEDFEYISCVDCIKEVCDDCIEYDGNYKSPFYCHTSCKKHSAFPCNCKQCNKCKTDNNGN